MANRIYKVSDLKKIIKESTSEFKPVMGKNVESDNKKNNEKAYKETSANVKKYDGGARSEKKKANYPYSDNLGMQDLEYSNMNKQFKDKVKSQMKGYVSADAEKKHSKNEYGGADFTEIEGMDKVHDDIQKGKKAAKMIGLTSREINKKDFDKQSSSIFGESKMKRIKFKNTEFITENQMLSKIPDDFKKEGNKFIVSDKLNNEFLVEWHNEDDPKVINESKINSTKSRIHELFNYKRENSTTTNSLRMNEESKITDMLNKTRILMK